jgi:hypothetical protein
MLNELILGVHLLSFHSHPGLETFTPGVYVRHPSGITAGAYSNSHGDPSAYIGHTFERGDFSLTAAGVAGYKNRTVKPIVLPTYSFSLEPKTRMVVGYVPAIGALRQGHLIHIAFERSIK